MALTSLALRKIEGRICGPEVSEGMADGSGGGTSEAVLEGEKSECESVQACVGMEIARTAACSTTSAEQRSQVRVEPVD